MGTNETAYLVQKFTGSIFFRRYKLALLVYLYFLVLLIIVNPVAAIIFSLPILVNIFGAIFLPKYFSRVVLIRYYSRKIFKVKNASIESKLDLIEPISKIRTTFNSLGVDVGYPYGRLEKDTVEKAILGMDKLIFSIRISNDTEKINQLVELTQHFFKEYFDSQKTKLEFYPAECRVVILTFLDKIIKLEEQILDSEMVDKKIIYHDEKRKLLDHKLIFIFLLIIGITGLTYHIYQAVSNPTTFNWSLAAILFLIIVISLKFIRDPESINLAGEQAFSLIKDRL